MSEIPSIRSGFIKAFDPPTKFAAESQHLLHFPRPHFTFYAHKVFASKSPVVLGRSRSLSNLILSHRDKFISRQHSIVNYEWNGDEVIAVRVSCVGWNGVKVFFNDKEEKLAKGQSLRIPVQDVDQREGVSLNIVGYWIKIYFSDQLDNELDTASESESDYANGVSKQNLVGTEVPSTDMPTSILTSSTSRLRKDQLHQLSPPLMSSSPPPFLSSPTSSPKKKRQKFYTPTKTKKSRDSTSRILELQGKENVPAAPADEGTLQDFVQQSPIPCVQGGSSSILEAAAVLTQDIKADRAETPAIQSENSGKARCDRSFKAVAMNTVPHSPLREAITNRITQGDNKVIAEMSRQMTREKLINDKENLPANISTISDRSVTSDLIVESSIIDGPTDEKLLAATLVKGVDEVSHKRPIDVVQKDDDEASTINKTDEQMQADSQQVLAPSVNDETFIGMLIDSLVFAHMATTPLPDMRPIFPKEWSCEQIQDFLREAKRLGYPLEEIERQGKNAAGEKIWGEWFYNPDLDTNRERAENLGPLRKPVRASRKQHKQYYWKKPSSGRSR